MKTQNASHASLGAMADDGRWRTPLSGKGRWTPWCALAPTNRWS